MKQQVIVKRYKTQDQYQRDANKMRAAGYEVISVASEQPRGGCTRLVLAIFTLGIFALLWKPKPVLVVTYRLTD